MLTRTYLFQDRKDAGKQLAKALAPYKGRKDTLILALPRGGVPVAYEAALELSLPMDIWLVRKLGVPGHEELAMGAITMGGIRHLNKDIVAMAAVSAAMVEQVAKMEEAELDRRNILYRHGRPLPDVAGKTVIVIDDGLATGATMRAAIESLRQAGSARIVAAVPVGSPSTCKELSSTADEVVCPHRPEPFYGVGQWYRDFAQTCDEDVQEILAALQA